MIQDVFGIKEFQINLPQIARQIKNIGGHYLITNRSKPAMVAIPFADYQQIEDILMELNSPSLQRDIAKGRKEYVDGKTQDFTTFLKENAIHNK
jgi:PHD/YefM family antitoxin component YafN of YafNO toxin-antitoxin module